MSQVAIEKVDPKKSESPSIFGEMKALSQKIQGRAYEIFERRRAGEGSDVDDWLKAESDLLSSAESDLIEQDGKFEVRVSAPGFDPGDVHVTALPDALIVDASSKHTHEKDEGTLHFCEFGQKRLFRRIDLPNPIDIDKVTAILNKGVLLLSAPKVQQESKPKVQTIAA